MKLFSGAYFLAATRFLGAALVAVLPVAAALAIAENVTKVRYANNGQG